MPVVPISKGRGGKATAMTPPRQPVPEPFALMAAAQMHAEGRLAPEGGDLPPQLGGKEPT
jgi:hypothetical protein